MDNCIFRRFRPLLAKSSQDGLAALLGLCRHQACRYAPSPTAQGQSKWTSAWLPTSSDRGTCQTQAQGMGLPRKSAMKRRALTGEAHERLESVNIFSQLSGGLRLDVPDRHLRAVDLERVPSLRRSTADTISPWLDSSLKTKLGRDCSHLRRLLVCGAAGLGP